jgi:exocyst complex component 2
MASLPSFWKVARGYMSGKYQKRDAATASVTRRSPAQCRSMTSGIVALYVDLLTDFFEAKTLAQEGVEPVLAGFAPPASCAMTAAHYLQRTLADLNDVLADLGGLALLDSDNAQLKAFLASLRAKFADVVNQLWVRGARVGHQLIPRRWSDAVHRR